MENNNKEKKQHFWHCGCCIINAWYRWDMHKVKQQRKQHNEKRQKAPWTKNSFVVSLGNRPSSFRPACGCQRRTCRCWRSRKKRQFVHPGRWTFWTQSHELTCNTILEVDGFLMIFRLSISSDFLGSKCYFSGVYETRESSTKRFKVSKGILFLFFCFSEHFWCGSTGCYGY